MFSQSKQSQPTFKIVIRSDLSSASPPNDHKTSLDSAPLAATTPTVDEAAQHRSSIPGSTTAGEGERKRKQSEKDGGFLTTKRVMYGDERKTLYYSLTVNVVGLCSNGEMDSEAGRT
jgi:hypothetical protein